MFKTKVNIGPYALSIVTSKPKPEPGKPLVVLETGLGLGADSWVAVHESLADEYDVLRYDRAGCGESDPAPKPRTALDMVKDLNYLLELWHPDGKIIFVGQSFGGLIARTYAGLYPHKVSGLILLDPTQENQFERVISILPPPSPSDSEGLLRFRQFWSEDYRHYDKNREGIDFPISLAQAARVKNLGDLPMLILAGSKPLPELADRPEEADKLQKLWLTMRLELAAISTRGVLRIVPDAGHFIQVDQPFVVVEAIREMIVTGYIS